jgi:hypothetical protein
MPTFAAVTVPAVVIVPAVIVPAVIIPALKLPEPSLLTIAFAVLLLVGAAFQEIPSVPLPLTGEPLTVKSEGALSPTLVTVPGKVWPEAKVIRPVGPIFSPVSTGIVAPGPNNRFNVPVAALVLLPAGSACQRKFCATGVPILLLNTEAVKFSACEFFPAVAPAVPVAGRLSKPRKMPVPLTSSVAPGEVLPMPSLGVVAVPDWTSAELPMGRCARPDGQEVQCARSGDCGQSRSNAPNTADGVRPHGRSEGSGGWRRGQHKR